MKNSLLIALVAANFSGIAFSKTVDCKDARTGYQLKMSLADDEPIRGHAVVTKSGKRLATLRCYDKPVWGCGTANTYQVTFMAFIRTLPLMHKGTKVADLRCN